jgi:F-type H+-transporting ATPase subunit b
MDIVGILEKIGFDFRIFAFNMINFSVVAFLLYKFVFKKIKSVLEKRQQMIEEGLENTVKSKEILESAEAQANQHILDAKLEAKRIQDEREEFAKQRQQELIAEAEAKASNVIEDATKKGEALVETKVAEFNNQSVDLVVETAKKLIETGQEVNTNNAQKLLKTK